MIAQTTAALTRLKPVLNERIISLSSKVQMMRSLTTLIFLYVCESWTSQQSCKEEYKPLTEMRCCHKMLRILYKDHVTNEKICAVIQQAIGPQEDLLIIVKRHKLKCCGHVSSSSGLAKPSCKARGKGEEDEADRKRGRKTTSRNGRAWSSPSPRGQWRTEKNGENWL